MGGDGTRTERGLAGRLIEASIAAADARRQLASGGDPGLALLQARLADVLACVDRSAAASDGEWPLVALLDELGGLVGQLELELEAIHASLVAARPAPPGRSYLRRGKAAGVTGPTPEMLPFGRAVSALAGVLLLMAGALWLLRRHGGLLHPAAAEQGLAVVATLVLDARVRLVLVRSGRVEHLLAVGSSSVSVLETRTAQTAGGAPQEAAS